jgi:hypothetical protein
MTDNENGPRGCYHPRAQCKGSPCMCSKNSVPRAGGGVKRISAGIIPIVRRADPRPLFFQRQKERGAPV